MGIGRRDFLKVLGGVAVSCLAGCIETVSNEVETIADLRPKMKLRWRDLNGELRPRTIEMISQYLDCGISYTTQEPGIWKSAKRTVDDGMGNCKNTAVLGAHLAEYLGYKPKLLLFAGDNLRPGHVVSFLEKDFGDFKRYGSIEPVIHVDPERVSLLTTFNCIDNLAIYLNQEYVNRKMVCYPYSKWKVVDLRKLDWDFCDWRRGSGNLARSFWKYTGFE